MPTVQFYLPYGTFGGRGSSGAGGGSGAASRPRRAWYSAHSEVILHWFRVGRAEPIAPYPSLLLGYSGLTAEGRARAERMVDEFFTVDEFHRLRDYLRSQHGEDLRTAVLSAPVSAVRPDGATRAGALRPFYPPVLSPKESGSLEGEPERRGTVPEGGIFRLSEEEGYSLPFAVWGYYMVAAQPEPLPEGLRSARSAAPPPLRV